MLTSFSFSLVFVFGLGDEDSSIYCLAEVGRNGFHSRAIPEDDYPVSWMASPFFDNLHDIYLCRRTQVSIGKRRLG